MIDTLKKYLEAAKEVLSLLVQISAILKRAWGIVLVLAIIGGIYAGLVYYAVYNLSDYIRLFFKSAERPATRDVAWSLLDPPFRNERWHDFADFDGGFKTTVAYSDISIRYAKNAWNPIELFSVLFTATPLDYEVSFTVRDSFTTADFKGDAQQDDLHWLHIAHRKTYELLKLGQLGNATNPNGTLEMQRTYKKRIELRKQPTWLISNIVTNEVSIVPSGD